MFSPFIEVYISPQCRSSLALRAISEMFMPLEDLCLKHYATSQKVTGLITDEANDFFSMYPILPVTLSL
jgi:hypothetical protein